MSILVLSHDESGSACQGFEWLDGPTDVTTMVACDKDGGCAEQLLTDGGEPEVLHSVPLTKWNDQTRTNEVTGHQKLLRFKGVRYVITKNFVRIDKTLKIEDVFPLWLGIQPAAPEAPPAE